MIGVEQWAEIRRLYFVKRLSIKEIVRRTGHSRNTIRRALRSGAPSEYRRPPRPSKLDPFRGEVHGLLRLDPRLPGKRMRELLEEQGGGGSLDPLPGQRMTLAISTEVSPPTRPAGASPGRDRRAPRAHRLHALREGRRLSGREPTVRSTSRRACRGGRSSEPGRPAHAGPSRQPGTGILPGRDVVEPPPSDEENLGNRVLGYMSGPAGSVSNMPSVSDSRPHTTNRRRPCARSQTAAGSGRRHRPVAPPQRTNPLARAATSRARHAPPRSTLARRPTGCQTDGA